MDYRELKAFEFEGKKLGVNYRESMPVTEGVMCHTYEFEGDKSRDLAFIEVMPGCRTPLQQVLKGEKTIEGHVVGKGTLTIYTTAGKKIYPVDDSNTGFFVPVAIGELMQWQATTDSELVFYEMCYPPYEDGRFKNLNEP